ncbi:MAG: hypothetical protein ACPIOQ_61370 [Promethearchaeia archaeon]
MEQGHCGRDRWSASQADNCDTCKHGLRANRGAQAQSVAALVSTSFRRSCKPGRRRTASHVTAAAGSVEQWDACTHSRAPYLFLLLLDLLLAGLVLRWHGAWRPLAAPVAVRMMAEGGSGPQNLRIEGSEKASARGSCAAAGHSDMATAAEQAVACIQVRAARMYHATVLQSPRPTSRARLFLRA